MPGLRVRRILLVVVALLIINVPYLLYRNQIHRVGSDGIQVVATVVSVDRAGDDVVLGLRFPKNVDPEQKVRSARVDATAGAAAVRDREVEARVLQGHPNVFEVDGLKRGHGATIVTLGADLLLLVVILLTFRLGGRLRRPALVAVALGDVEDGEDGSLLDKQEDGTYLINGEVTEADAESLVLRLRDRNVRVHLRGYTNPVVVGERAKVLGHLVG